jgi:hypothetical protein
MDGMHNNANKIASGIAKKEEVTPGEQKQCKNKTKECTANTFGSVYDYREMNMVSEKRKHEKKDKQQRTKDMQRLDYAKILPRQSQQRQQCNATDKKQEYVK